MRKQIGQWFFIVFFLINGSEKVFAQAKPATPTPPPAPFKFSISFDAMVANPRKSQVIVEKELGTDLASKTVEESEARVNLALGYEAKGDVDSAAKNYARCKALDQNPHENANTLTKCLVGLARLERSTTAGYTLEKLYNLRNDKLVTPAVKAEYFAELINNYSFHRDFAKAKQVLKEGTAGQLSPGDEYLLRFAQAFMLFDAKEFPAAEAALKQARLAAKMAKHSGKQSEAWLNHIEGNYYLGIKDFTKAKASYDKATYLLTDKEAGIYAFWLHYLAIKIGYYTGAQALVDQSVKKCAEIIRGTELEPRYSALINAWAKLQKRGDISAEIATLNTLMGPNTNLVEDLKVAQAWQKPK